MGADAIYLAGKNFGARSFASNFDRAETEKCMSMAHLRGVKVYVAVNTLIGDREIPELVDYLKFLDSIRADGIIVQDLSVPELVRKYNLSLRLHASTQMTVHNLKGAQAAAELGFSRVVLARELSFEEIKHISKNIDIETEIFVHGAMCVSLSGQCLMSSALGGRSGNRGSCAQPCRRRYRSGGKEKYILSLKDMSLINRVDKLFESGSSALKIEGRMKGPAYVAAVTRIFRSCLDERRKPTEAEAECLSRVFCRGGLTCGYFDGEKGKSMFAFDRSENPYAESSRATEKGILKDMEERDRRFKIPLWAEVDFYEGRPMRLKVKTEGGDETVTDTGPEKVGFAKTMPTTSDTVKKQLSKTGGSIFEFEDIVIHSDNKGFVPLSVINDLRRRALEAVRIQILERYGREHKNKPVPASLRSHLPLPPKKCGFTADVSNYGQFRAILEFEKEFGNSVRYIGVPIDKLWEKSELYLGEKDRIIILPRNVMHRGEYEDLDSRLRELGGKGFSKVRAENISAFEWQTEFEVFGGFRLNITNALSAEVLIKSLGLRTVFLSPELNISQMGEIASRIPSEIGIYGYQPLMITENCIGDNLGFCPCKDEVYYLVDRLGKKFPILRDGKSCRSVIFNSCPTFMCDKAGEIEKKGAALLNLSFTVEDEDEVSRVLSACFGGDYRPKEFTRFHFNKGAITEKAGNKKD